MTREWTCLYCSGSNPYHARFCVHCNAKLPDIKFSASIHTGEADDEQAGEPETQPEVQETALEIPKPGSLVGSLFSLCNSVLNEEISPSEFGERIRRALESVDSIFGSIYEGIGSTDTQAEEYKEQVLTLLENVQFMFVKALEEILLFEDDQAPYHIRYGRMLAQRAELEYIQIVEMLVYDASGSYNPFEGAPFVLGNLAEEFYCGELSLDEFKQQLKDLEKVTNGYFEKGSSLVKEGFALADRFDGNNGEILQTAIDKLAEAGDEISKAIINLHTQEEIKGTMNQILENTPTEATFE